MSVLEKIKGTWVDKGGDLQSFKTIKRNAVDQYGENVKVQAIIRYDDQCRNGHASFAITGDVWGSDGLHSRCGCVHEDIAEAFPELAPFLKWHLMNADGPTYYVENTHYHARLEDHWGLLKDQKRQIKDRKTGQLAWRLGYLNEKGEEVEAPQQYVDGDIAPEVGVKLAYVPWCYIGEGKERDLPAARTSAIWPEATDDQLCLPKEELEALLQSRLPQLIADFKADLKKLGLKEMPGRKS